jgi:glycosyltransferase involved in cell wall biosynthesis
MRNSVVNRTRWPNKFGDYLAGGRPVLCSNVGDVATIVRSEECGFVWNNIHELCQGIEILMEDASLASRMGERARQLAEGRLSWQRLASEFAEVYRKVCA